jgi:hypothetical protein
MAQRIDPCVYDAYDLTGTAEFKTFHQRITDHRQIVLKNSVKGICAEALSDSCRSSSRRNVLRDQ